MYSALIEYKGYTIVIEDSKYKLKDHPNEQPRDTIREIILVIDKLDDEKLKNTLDGKNKTEDG